jgi:hypothetical protein
MRIVHIGCGAMFLLLSGVIAAPGAEQATASDRDAGTWKTWVISSGKDFRAPPPPAGRRDGYRDRATGLLRRV